MYLYSVDKQKITVKTKSFSIKTLNLSGTTLFLYLGVVLSLAAISLDFIANRFSNPLVSLTLPFVVSILAATAMGYWAIPILQKLKTGQVIREDGPQAHLQKAGTPTMGGAFFVPVGIVIALLWSGFKPEVLAVAILTFLYAFIGWIDDWQIIRRKSNKGISPRMKLTLQIVFAALFCLGLALTQPESITNLYLPFGLTINLGLLFWPFAVFVLVAESNATNITDGIDGLAGGLGAIALLGLAVLVAPSSPNLMIFCACMGGCYLGFVSHNRNPARVFMGDTGSLALGGAIASVAILTNNIWGVFLISGIFFVETLSVMAQVSYYKSTKGPDGVGKRLFKMAPLHHHLELSGWSEIQIVAVFYIINCCLDIISFLWR